MLFIITHQSYELWFKQINMEVSSICDIFNHPVVPESSMLLAVRRLHRVSEIQRVCITQFKILETMTPMEFIDFRDALVPASGFQSYQFRELEILLGMQEETRSKLRGCQFLSALQPRHEEYLKEVITKPTLFSLVERWLERTPFVSSEEWSFWGNYQKAVKSIIQRDKEHIDDEWKQDEISGNSEQRKELADLEEKFQALFSEEKYLDLQAKGHFRLSQNAFKAALVIMLYREESLFHLPFEFLNSLIEIDNNMSLFRHAHATMVHRMIGSRMGTGGSSGVSYLRSTTGLRYKVFNDLINVSTYTIPSSSLPPIPASVKAKMNFFSV